MILKAYVVPHPPIILPEVGRGEERKIQNSIDAMQRMAKEVADIQPDTIIISSPHAPMYLDGFFLAGGKDATGTLAQFGIRSVTEKITYDVELADRLKAVCSDIPFASPEQANCNLDHGTLIPIRFINEHYRNYKVLRLGLSGFSPEDHYRLGVAIQEVVAELDRRAVYIASGDLSHVLKEDGPYGFREQGPLFDETILQILSRSAFDELLALSPELIEAAAQCGTKSFQIMAGVFDGFEVTAELYSYEGPFGVGYGVLGFTPGKPNPKRRFLGVDELADSTDSTFEDPYIKLARQTIETFVGTGQKIAPPEDLPDEMTIKQAGVFVTLHKGGQLRGCIGTISPTTDSIAEEIIQNGISSATRDPRFPAVTADELPDLKISVDILGAPEAIDKTGDLDPQRYGVIVTSGFRRGLLLPRLEGIDDVATQLSIALQKAGIRSDESFEMERFEVIRHE